jgi:glycosyltransferase involved in cell wall biosynthesis
MQRDPSLSPLVFVLPPGSDAPSGGNVYNRELSRALAAHVSVTVTDFSAAERSLAERRPGSFFFDTLELERAASLARATPERALGLLVHHLPSLEPGAAREAPELARENALLAHFRRFVATSDFTRELLAERKLPLDSILTVPPAAPDRALLPRSYEPPLRALVVANVVPRKGVLELVEALARVSPRNLPCSLRIVGRLDMDAAYVERCRTALPKARGLVASVELVGPVPYERMGAVYEDADLLVSASGMETFGMAIHEARSHGLPVVALAGGYVSQHFRDGDDGVLRASPVELAQTLVELALDEPRMRALFARARANRTTSTYSWDGAAVRFLAELERAKRAERPARG